MAFFRCFPVTDGKFSGRLGGVAVCAAFAVEALFYGHDQSVEFREVQGAEDLLEGGAGVRIVVVEHSPVLFRGSILDNLRYGHPEVDAASAIDAARKALVDEFVSALPQGYDTQVGERGSELSTGQRQRIAIARAALARPLIVILDEATSGLDAEAARAVHRSLDSTFPERTRLVITHRAGDVERSDVCWQLEAGRLRPALLAG